MRIHRVIVALLAPAFWSVALPALAQPKIATPSTTGISFLPRTEETFLWGAMQTTDPRFHWDGVVTFDADLVDYGRGRTNFSASYEGVIGRERRHFDLNHGNYMLEMSSSLRLQSVEIFGAYHHVSRHLVDRENPGAISWNLLEARALRRFTFATSTLDTAFRVGQYSRQAFVDYVWMANLSVMFRHFLNRRTGLFAYGWGETRGLDPDVAHRTKLCGVRVDGGLRVDGSRGAVEFFGGYERRMDAFPTDRYRLRFWTIGFRLVTK